MCFLPAYRKWVKESDASGALSSSSLNPDAKNVNAAVNFTNDKWQLEPNLSQMMARKSEDLSTEFAAHYDSELDNVNFQNKFE